MTLAEAHDFFGGAKINAILVRIALSEDGPPEWLRGRPALADLPRFDGGVLENVVPVSSDLDVFDALPSQLVWIVETLKAPWSLTIEGWSFDDLNEALYFKMAF